MLIVIFSSQQRYLARLRSAFVVSNFHLPRVQIPALALQSSSWIRDLREKCHASFRNHPVLFILSLLLTLIVLSKSTSIQIGLFFNISIIILGYIHRYMGFISHICCQNLIETRIYFLQVYGCLEELEHQHL